MFWARRRYPRFACHANRIALMTMADGVLVFAAVHESNSKLYLWSRVSGTKGYAGWAQCQAIDLQPLLLPIGTLPASFDISYFEDRVAAIFMGPYCAFFTMDLKPHKIKIPEGNVAWPVIPYMSFYTPGFNLLSFGFVNIQN